MKKPIPFGKYYLLERINVGGMAEVFRAKAFGVEGFERLLAVKRILPNIAEDRDFISMFVDEAKIAVQLNHANIAQVFDLGEEDGAYYIALEHVHGRDVRVIFDRGRTLGQPMPVAQACFVCMKVCEGLDYAHNKRDTGGRELHLVHRDVSPQNILVSFEGEVKLIDFGIAKAAGKGAKTQAGILKGKFGYMSPEQVRGLPIDRRSDVFSCGVVLYELLTGERLFVGESDFSTLEKVRNVEILPPSTYNRRIQPELERIVLKALAKDVEERYQNAIDLHDELQAFVYSTGEFYSRKDLAGWMKKVFAKEIEEESAKLESLNNMSPPTQASVPVVPKRERAPTMSLGSARKTLPPPIPSAARPSQAMAAVAPESAPEEALSWDEDELETSIYDEEPPASTALPTAQVAGAAAQGRGKDDGLESLVATSTGWDAPQNLATNGEPPSRVADGSNRTPAPEPAAGDPAAVLAMAARRANPHAEGAPLFGDGADLRPPPRRSNRFLLNTLIAASILIAVGIVAVVLVGSNGDEEGEKPGQAVAKSVEDSSLVEGAGAADVGSAPSGDTGFDLIVQPAGAQIRLDGKELDQAPPLEIRNLRPGEHVVEVIPPAGFLAATRTIQVEDGKAHREVIRLETINVEVSFMSEPSGAEVTLVADGKRSVLGRSPTTAGLPAAAKVDVIFEKRGYTTVTRPVELTGVAESSEVMVSLEKEKKTTERPQPVVAKVDTPTNRPKPTPPRKEEPPPKRDPVKETAPAVNDEGGEGTLLVSAKPPCRIFVDGADTGMTTPKKMKIPAGRHKITLVNNEHGIKELFEVKIRSGKVTKAIKSYLDQVD